MVSRFVISCDSKVCHNAIVSIVTNVIDSQTNVRLANRSDNLRNVSTIRIVCASYQTLSRQHQAAD